MPAHKLNGDFYLDCGVGRKQNNNQESKVCSSCGRRFDYQKRWEKNWESVKYCGKSCRREKLEKRDLLLETTILEMLAQRDKGKTICPSEVLPEVNMEINSELMERCRRAARRLVARGQLKITQKGQVVDASAFKGPIRLRLP